MVEGVVSGFRIFFLIKFVSLCIILVGVVSLYVEASDLGVE